MNDSDLINAFNKDQAEAAFRSLVERHLPLVLGTARRITEDSGLAEEIAQTVFILLARKASSFTSHTVVPGWLYRTTCFVARRALRGERRRRLREQEAVSMQTQSDPTPSDPSLAPHLDDGLRRLSSKERDALLLRFYQEKSLNEVAGNLGISEDAAKKRVARGLDKLRHFFSRRGTQITSAALVAGLAHESAKAAISSVVISKVTAAALAPAASSALLLDVLAAWRWAKIKLLLSVSAGVVATTLLVSKSISANRHSTADRQSLHPTAASGAAPAGSQTMITGAPGRAFDATEIGGKTVSAHPLEITVLDAATGKPIPGANVMHSLMWQSERQSKPVPLKTDAKGLVTFPVPNNFPGDERMNQFSVFVSAKGHAPRDIMWLCSTGGVLNLVSNAYIVHLETGVTLSGTVVEDSGQPLPNARVGIVGNNYKGYSYSTDGSGKVISPPVIRVEDYSEFSQSSEDPDAVETDRAGRFHFDHFPSDLKALLIDVIGPDGARRKFRTPQGKSLSADDLSEVPFQDFPAGTARLVLPHGPTVAGVILNSAGEPVPGAAITEATHWGNLKILSTSYADFEGRFWLSNRPPHEILLTASAGGYASVSAIVTIKKGMAPVQIQLPPQLPLRARILNDSNKPISGADISLYDICNEGVGIKWSAKSDSSGRFEWQAAPTNELALMISGPGELFRLIRLRATTNEQVIVLRADTNGSAASITGHVTDAATGSAVEHFSVQLCHGRATLPEVARTVAGERGHFEVSTSQSEVPVGDYPYWYLVVEADGYAPLETRHYDYAEGNQDLDLKLQPGGTAEGIVRTPQGDLATNCELAIATSNRPLFAGQPGRIPRYSDDNPSHSDSSGHFKMALPIGAQSALFFHDSGWAVVPLAANSQGLQVRLRPWGCIHGQLIIGGAPVTNENVGLKNLVQDNGNPLDAAFTETTDEDGNFAFKDLPEGEYQVSFEPKTRQRIGADIVESLQTAVKISAGQTNFVRLEEDGLTLTAKLHAPDSATSPVWTNCVAILNRNITAPPEPSRADFITEESFVAARLAYKRNPATVAAARKARSYIGDISAGGSAIFQNVPPGDYLLDVKVYSPPEAGQFSPKTIARLSIPVTVPAGTSGQAAPINLGDFTLEAF